MTWNIAHRGASGLEPENTLRAFLRAAEVGADALELDLRLTRDGYLVVMHDATLERTTNGTGSLSSMTLDEVRQLDAGLGERVPTFEEVLEFVDLPIYAELKQVEAAEPLVEFIRTGKLDGRIVPISFDPEALRRVRRALPDLPLSLIFDGVPPDAIEQAGEVGLPTGQAGTTLVSLEATALDEGMVERCRQAGLDVIAGTVNDPETLRRTLELGVYGITTDRPDILSEVMRS